MRRHLLTVALGLACVCATVQAQAPAAMYWVESGTGKLRRAQLDGSQSFDLLVGLQAPSSLAVDSLNGHVYVADAGVIYRVDLDGSGFTLVTSGPVLAQDLDADPLGGFLYWSSWLLQAVYRSQLDGSGTTSLVGGLPGAQAIALDPAAGKLYWSAWDSVGVAGLDGSASTVLYSGLGDPRSIAVDPTNGHLFWAEAASRRIQRANLDGSGGLTDIVTTGVSLPSGLAVDVTAGFLYWTDPGTGNISRTALDGTGLTVLLTGAPGADLELGPTAGCPAYPGIEVVRAGSPPNPLAFQPAPSGPPILGRTWDPYVTPFLSGAVLDFAINAGPVPLNLPLGSMGTLLCALPPLELIQFVPPGLAFSFPIPVDCSLVGAQRCVQGGSVAAGPIIALANALDISIGTY
jgi:sugar lactone lactonase YvrE